MTKPQEMRPGYIGDHYLPTPIVDGYVCRQCGCQWPLRAAPPPCAKRVHPAFCVTQFGTQRSCAKCNQVWDANDPHPPSCSLTDGHNSFTPPPLYTPMEMLGRCVVVAVLLIVCLVVGINVGSVLFRFLEWLL